jgi:hypothetical protein
MFAEAYQWLGVPKIAYDKKGNSVKFVQNFGLMYGYAEN